MITVEIPKKDLLRQLPQQAGYALLQWFDEMPQIFTFEALPCQTKAEFLEEKYPEIRKQCTQYEWVIFVGLYERGKVRYSTLYSLFRYEDRGLDITANSNILSVHVKNLRKQLRLVGAPFSIITHRAGAAGEGQFEMLQI